MDPQMDSSMDPDMDTTGGWRLRLFAVLSLLVGLVFAGGILEGVARWHPLERIQVVSLSQVDSEVVDGVPIWQSKRSVPERVGRPCEARPEVVLVGSSILWGSGISDSESPRSQLAQRLPEACVTLLGQPAYSFSNQRVEVARHLETHTPRVVVWEIWHNSPHEWSVLGDVAYNFGPTSVDTETLPSPFGLPPQGNLVLFSHSAAYRHMVVSRLSSNHEGLAGFSTRFASEQLAPVLDGLRQRGVHLVLAYMPPLSRPFEESARSRSTLYAMVDETVGASVESVWVAEQMAARNVDVVGARVDTCCHYSASGSAALADILSEAVAPLLERVATTAPQQP